MPSANPATQPLKTAVITGGHPFDVFNFHALFRSLEGVDAYIQHMDDFTSSSEAHRDQYAVVLFYHMLMETPQEEQQPSPFGDVKAVLESLAEKGQGLVVLHHAILAYPQWPEWNGIVGIEDRSFGFYHDQSLALHIENSNHPITQGLQDWSMLDETYTMASASAGSEILITADHPLSMRTLAWARRHKNSRVFCFQSGHDAYAFGDPSFRRVLARGIQWAGGLFG